MVMIEALSVSSHAFRSSRRRAAITRKDDMIAELTRKLAGCEAELSSWWSWWHGWHGCWMLPEHGDDDILKGQCVEQSATATLQDQCAEQGDDDIFLDQRAEQCDSEILQDQCEGPDEDEDEVEGDYEEAIEAPTVPDAPESEKLPQMEIVGAAAETPVQKQVQDPECTMQQPVDTPQGELMDKIIGVPGADALREATWKVVSDVTSKSLSRRLLKLRHWWEEEKDNNKADRVRRSCIMLVTSMMRPKIDNAFSDECLLAVLLLAWADGEELAEKLQEPWHVLTAEQLATRVGLKAAEICGFLKRAQLVPVQVEAASQAG